MFVPLPVIRPPWDSAKRPLVLKFCLVDTLSDEKGDAYNKPAPGYSTVRFSNGGPGEKGQLDRYCALERTYYFVAVAIMYEPGLFFGFLTPLPCFFGLMCFYNLFAREHDTKWARTGTN